MARTLKALTACGKTALATGLGLFLFAAAATAAPDWKLVELRAKLTALSDELRTDGMARSQSVSELVDEIAWPARPDTARPSAAFVEPTGPASIGWTDMRVALAALSQVYGGIDNQDVMLAVRGGDTAAIAVHAGTATLRQLRNGLTNFHLGTDFETGADLLRAPIIIGEDATLRLGPDDILQLSRRDGAFIVNFGRLEVFGAEIAGTPEANQRTDEFAPFIVTLGSGSAHLSGATLKRLGFGNTAKFAGFSVVAYPTLRPTGRTIVENSRFDDLVTLALVGVPGVELHDNRFFDMRRNPVLISRSPDALVRGNLFSGRSPTNAIRLANGSGRARLIGNIVLEGSRVGLLVASGSDNAVLRGNLIWRRDGGGIKLLDVNCGRVEHNIILDDRQKGVEVRSSDDALVHGNTIVGNKNAGLWVSAQTPDAVTYVTANLLRENGAGLATAAGARIALQGNDLSNQFPRLLDGDITQQFRTIIADMRGQMPILMHAGGSQPTDQLAPAACAM